MTGLRFSETMTGRVSLRTSDPVAGFESVGAVAAWIHADVKVDDVDDFVMQELPVAGLRAELVIPVLGVCAVSNDGTFTLFKPGVGPDRRRVREILYTATFVDGDRVYDVRARKLLQPSWHLWRDTTTAHLVVHATMGKAAQTSSAAGFVKISPWGFLVQLVTMRGFGGASGANRCGAVLTYSRFFVRGLAKTYLRRARW
ncbi:hypothetical protein H7K45_16705 [Mycobacterium yunnanensis]|uniref:Uncharacterized protein n=1 Tax=Mycobacterium yunnanensis TaxID=368477 RepID=A0A9X2Z5P2_9MYCO|nr:hypothetical protein [Mycobacterium yunnanensis]MCV7422192.1 hypothetical protein [Mycobacterium yunnanensis]